MTSSGISVLALFKNESTNLAEWISHYLDQQVEKIILVDNGSTDHWRPIVQSVDSESRVICLSDNRKHAQVEIYRSVFKSGVISTEWLLVCDIDEFAYARSGFSSLRDYLDQGISDDVGAVMLPWKNFGSSGFIHQPSSLRTHFVKRGKVPYPEPFPGHSRGKYICRVPCTFDLSVHRPLLSRGKYMLSSGRDISNALAQIRQGFVPNNEDELALSFVHLNHYAAQSLQYFKEIKSTRGDVYHSHLESKDISYFKKFDTNDVLDDELALMTQNRAS
jgi:glycosyltransferase involved in cell wall biosynthesis